MATRADRRYTALRQTLSRLFTLAAALLMGVSAYLFRWEQPRHPLLEATLLMLLGGLSLCFALLIRPASIRAAPIPAQPNHSRGFNVWLFLPGLLAFLLLIENNSGLLHIDLLAHLTLGVQLALFIIGIIFITAAFAGFRFSRPRWRRGRFTFRSLVPGLLLLLITLLAFVVRDWQLGTSVRRLIDEINFANAIVGLRLSTQDLKLLAPFSGITAFPWLFPYVQSLFVTLGGRNLESMRFLSVLLGTLGVPALYLLAKTLFDRRTAMLAALLLATFPPHIQFSRIALNNIADPLFGTLMLAFLARALKSGNRADYALAGTMLGLTQYFYEGGRFLYPALALLWIAWHILLKRFQPTAPLPPPWVVRASAKTEPSMPAVMPRQRSPLTTFFLSAVVISLPLYITLLSLHQSLSQRFEIVGLGGSYWLRVQQVGTLQTPEEQFLAPLLVYVHLPEIGQYYGGEQGMLLPSLVLFFMFGGFVLLWRWRSPGFMLVLWLLLTSAGNVLLTDSAIYARYVVVFPALVLITVVGIRSLPALLFASKRSPAQRARFRLSLRVPHPVISTLLALFLAAVQVAYFFGPHLQTYNRQIRPFPDAEDAVFRGAALPYGTVVHIISQFAPPSNYLSTLMLYLVDGVLVESLAPDKVSRPYLASMPPAQGHAFFIQRDDISTLAYLRQSFKDDLQGPFNSPYDVPPAKQLVLYYLPAIPQG